jgi:hypothetical protein
MPPDADRDAIERRPGSAGPEPKAPRGRVTNVFDDPLGVGAAGRIDHIGRAVHFSNPTIDGAPAGSDFGGAISAAPEPATFALPGVVGLLLRAPVLRREARVAA